LITYPLDVADADSMFEAALEAGATEVETTDEVHEISCEPDELHAVLDELVKQFGDSKGATLDWKPTNTTEVDAEKAQSLFGLVEALEDLDDVQDVFTNMEVSDEVMSDLAG
jgi:transcriptional/translational regulatory protein YebC/TACO1